MTPSQFADTITRSFEPIIAEYINERAPKLYFASYSKGTYGRIMLPLIKKYAPNMNLNGLSTDIALAITGSMERKGYDYHVENGTVTFRKGAKNDA